MDYGMLFFWLVIFVITLVAEILTAQMVSIWFTCASAVCMIFAGINAPRWIQFSVFVAVTALLLILTMPLVKKIKKAPEKTNVDINIGKDAVVTEAIHNEQSKGRATVGGVSWKAVSSDGSVIEKGEVVKVLDIDGAKLIVSK